MRIVIAGAGGHAQVVADAVRATSAKGGRVQVIGFLDDNPDLHGRVHAGLEVLGPLEIASAIQWDGFIVAIGDNAARSRAFQLLIVQGRTAVSVIHPRATVARDVQVGAGSVVLAGAVINTGALIGNNVIINTGSTVDHHCRIGSHAHIGPGANLGGGVTVGEGSFLGIGSAVIPGRTIGNWSTIGAGGVVIEDIADHVTAVGVPAKPVQSQ